MRTLYNHHNVPVGKAAIARDDEGREAVYVRFDNTKTHYSDCIVPLENFNDWKKVRDLKEVVDMDDNDKQMDIFEV